MAKRSWIAVALLLLFGSPLFSQGKLEGGIYAEYFQLGYRGFQHFGGILHVPVGKSMTLNYRLGFGTSTNGGLFVHTTGGAVAGFWILDQVGGGGNIGYLTFLLCLVPEGVGYYFPTRGKLTPHLSINPLSVEYYYKAVPYEEWGKLGCDVVARFKMQTNFRYPAFVAPHVAATFIYTPGKSTGRFGLKAGVTIGFERKDRE